MALIENISIDIESFARTFVDEYERHLEIGRVTFYVSGKKPSINVTPNIKQRLYFGRFH
jgi:hypothetical protein